MAPAISHLVLVGAMGIKPPQGDILDLAITGYMDYARAGFHDQKHSTRSMAPSRRPTSSRCGTSAAR